MRQAEFRRRGWVPFWLTVAILGVFGAMAAVYGTLTGEPAYPRASSGISVSVSSYLGGPSTVEAARRADLVAVPILDRKLPPFWNTPDHKRPELQGLELLLSPYRIFTPFVLRVERVLKGEEPAGGEVLLNLLGGRIAEDVVNAEEHSIPEVGARVVAFLRDCGGERANLMGHPLFRYRIIDIYTVSVDGRVLSMANDPPLRQLITLLETEGPGPPKAVTNC